MKFVLIGTHSAEWIDRTQERGQRAFAKCKALGISVLANYFTQGQFDFVTVIESPSAESASAFSIWYMKQGFGRVQTLLAYDAEAFATVLEKASHA
jgi:uncharacterized protein with GYD domain